MYNMPAMDSMLFKRRACNPHTFNDSLNRDRYTSVSLHADNIHLRHAIRVSIHESYRSGVESRSAKAIAEGWEGG